MSALALTARQAQVLGVIRQHLAQTGRPPTYDGIAAAIGIRGRGRIHAIIGSLVERGHVRRLPRRHGALALSDGHGAFRIMLGPEAETRLLDAAAAAGCPADVLAARMLSAQLTGGAS